VDVVGGHAGGVVEGLGGAVAVEVVGVGVPVGCGAAEDRGRGVGAARVRGLGPRLGQALEVVVLEALVVGAVTGDVIDEVTLPVSS
jgi:hypothetical protein